MTTHREGSRKQKVHQLFDSEGEAAAFTLGTKLKLKASTLHTWFSKWRTASVKDALVKNAKKTKPAAKAKVTKVKVAA